MSENSIIDKLTGSYKQALLFLLVVFVYSILSSIVIGIGITMIIANVFNGSTGGFAIGMIIFIIGYILLFVGLFAGFIFAGTRGVNSVNPVGFIDAYVESFKLILELMIVIAFAIVLFIIGNAIGGAIMFGFGFIGMIILLLFPIAGQFYVIEYLKSR